MRIFKDFHSRPADEQRWIAENTWCDACAAADLGLDNPPEYFEGGVRSYP
jgi:hypothetical protein